MSVVTKRSVYYEQKPGVRNGKEGIIPYHFQQNRNYSADAADSIRVYSGIDPLSAGISSIYLWNADRVRSSDTDIHHQYEGQSGVQDDMDAVRPGISGVWSDILYLCADAGGHQIPAEQAVDFKDRDGSVYAAGSGDRGEPVGEQVCQCPSVLLSVQTIRVPHLPQYVGPVFPAGGV